MASRKIVCLVAAVVVILAVATDGAYAKGEMAQRGGGGGARGAPSGDGKPSSPSDRSSESAPSSQVAKPSVPSNSYSAPPRDVGSRSNPYYGSPGYGMRYNSLSNFFLWWWIFHHDRENPDYQYEYGGESNEDVGGWLLSGIGATGIVGGLGWWLRRRLTWQKPG